MLEFLPVALGLTLFTLASFRPLLAAVVSAAASGLALCASVKRETLCEPAVFADRAELLDLFEHPRLHPPFSGTTIVVGGAAAIVGILARRHEYRMVCIHPFDLGFLQARWTRDVGVPNTAAVARATQSL